MNIGHVQCRSCPVCFHALPKSPKLSPKTFGIQDASSLGDHFAGGLWLALLRPSPEFITQSLTHRTQIVYHADISLLRALLDARPGRIICEAGTGSGSVSASLSRALRPNGKLYTFEFHEERQKQAMADFSSWVRSFCWSFWVPFFEFGFKCNSNCIY